MEAFLIVAALAVGFLPLAAVARRTLSPRIRVAALAAWTVLPLGAGAAAVRYRPQIVAEAQVTDRPLQIPEAGYVSSDGCRSCHPSNYASWYGSYHRRMTQLPTPEAVIAPWGGTELHRGPVSFRLQRRRDEFWVTIVDPARNPPQEDARVVLLTGSHHQQRYWMHAGQGRQLSALPFIYLREDRRWIPVNAAFVKPAQDPEGGGLDISNWNSTCINCHTTHGRMSATGKIDDHDARVEEFGIACEACHGPADQHVARNRDPARRYQQHLTGSRDPSIVNPANLTGLRASQVCGQCHGITGEKIARDFPMDQFLSRGSRYRPGDELTDTSVLMRYTDPVMREMMPKVANDPGYWEKSFWSDGMVRVSGREYNGLVESPCAKSEKFSCMSCHQMHPRPDDPRRLAAWADDQLAPGMDGDRACLDCHAQYATPQRLAAHTHHQPASAGSRCLDCHMPYTTWGLLKATRSHQVSSPTVAASLQTGRPNACNQCHLDRTLAWTAGHLATWYGTPLPTLTQEQTSIAASVLWLLKGDGGQRALMAWSYGWDVARAASGAGWQAPHLATLLDDPYDAVRLVAGRSLRRLPGFGDFDYDFLAPHADLALASKRALQRWNELVRSGGDPSRRTGSAILIESNGSLQQDLASSLLRQRDDRPVALQE